MEDFNADGSYFSEKTMTGIREKAYTWAINDSMGTTVAENIYTYDRIVFEDQYTAEDFMGKSRVFRFDKIYRINVEAKRVSDHYPVLVFAYGHSPPAIQQRIGEGFEPALILLGVCKLHHFGEASSGGVDLTACTPLTHYGRGSAFGASRGMDVD